MIYVLFRRSLRRLSGREPAMMLLGMLLIAVLSIASSAVIAYLHFERIAASERLAAERAERANAELQAGLSRMRDQLAAAQLRIEALTGELAAAQARMRAVDDWARQFAAYQQAAYQQAAYQRAIPARGRFAVSPKASGSVVPLVDTPPTAEEQPAPEQPSPAVAPTAVAAASGQVRNFTAPGWVPSYFSSESAPFLGASKQ